MNGNNGQYGNPGMMPQQQQQPQQQQYQQQPQQQYQQQPSQYQPVGMGNAMPPQGVPGSGGGMQPGIPGGGNPQGGGMLTVNMQDQSAAWEDTSGGPPLTPGQYQFEVVTSDAGNSQSGNPVMKVRLRVVDGVRQGVEFNYTYTVLTGVHRIRGLMNACWGQERPSFAPAEFIGCRFSAEVKHRTRDDNVFMELRAHKAINAGAQVGAQPQQSVSQQGQGTMPQQQQQQSQPQQQAPTGMWTNTQR